MPRILTLFSTLVFVIFFLPVFAFAQGLEQLPEEKGRPITFEDMYSLGRVSDPQISPNGNTVLYVVTYYSLETNKGNSDIYSVDIAGKTSTALAASPATDTHPRWSPDGRAIAFISSRDGSPQIWMMNADGTNPQKITNLSTGATGVEWSPTGTHLVFTSSTFPECTTDECNKLRQVDVERNPCKAQVFETLPYRVWNSWKEGKFSHVYSIPAAGGPARDATPGPYDTPPIDIGGDQDYAVSRDGKEIAFVRNTDRLVAASTNNDIWIANLDGSNARCITSGNKANDNQPVYSPDGNYIAYRAMSRPGYEADTYDLVVYDRRSGSTRNLTHGADRSVDEIIWSVDSKRIFFTAHDDVYFSLFEVPVSGGDILRVLKGIVTLRFKDGASFKDLELGTLRSSFRMSPDGKSFVFVGQRINYPAELMSLKYENGNVTDIKQLTHTNEALLKKLDMPEAESFTFKSFDGVQVQGWMLTPPNFDPTKKYPMIFLAHGGPQGVWADEFHYRWNLELFASPGFVVVAINPRGSQGWGQAFVDGVNGNWGGAPYKDLMTGLDFVLKKYPFIDKNRIGAAGASYGGYMMDWMLGSTNRFKAIFTHSGVYDLASMYGGTEELWFPEWEFRGTPWSNPKMYDKWSPSKLAKNFKTPTLVSHGQLDFRVPVEQSMQLFSTLQRMGVESKFMYFPDEGHTILKPRNSQFWYREFHAWFKKYLMEK